MADTELLLSIHRVDQDISECQSKIKGLREAINESLSESSAAKEIEALRERIKELRQQQSEEAHSDPAVRQLLLDMEEEANKLRDLKEILSHHLVMYHDQTSAGQVPLQDNAKAKPIVISAKLGKEEAYQEQMEFSNESR